MTDVQDLTRRLVRRAKDEGFDAVAVAAAGRLKRDGSALQAWLSNGHHATMEWMERRPDKRADPREILHGCRNVVTLALNYRPPEGTGPSDEAAKVAAYALGRDYHKVLGKKLRRVAVWLEETSGAVAQTFVDTGPVLERAWAEQGGLGWIGKNANLITREMGSWFLLGEILTTASLVASPGPHVDFCGSCSACMEACPTDAILEPGIVDSRRCISFWTIEHRGPIPEEVRSGVGEWIFGCDVCQEVCPWNRRFSRTADADPLERREDLSRLDPERILAMDETTFRRLYSGTSLMRAKWEGMRRNACIVLGNRKRRDALPALGRALDDPDPVVREHAKWAIRVIGDSG